VEIDERSSRNLSDPQIMVDTFYSGYKTVEEMYAFLDQKAAQFPTLVEKIDIGDSWCKSHPGACVQPSPWNGYDFGFTTLEYGFGVLVDWATSAISMGRVQQLAREGQPLPADAAINSTGAPTTNPADVAGLLPFGAHKGYGLGLLNEVFAAMIGAYLPKLRGRPSPSGQKNTCCFHFMAIHPEAISSGSFEGARTMDQNLRAVLENILTGNDNTRIPGASAAKWRERSRSAGGLLFTPSELNALNDLAKQAGVSPIDRPDVWSPGSSR